KSSSRSRTESSRPIISGRAAAIASKFRHSPIMQKVRSPVLTTRPLKNPLKLGRMLWCASMNFCSHPGFTRNRTTFIAVIGFPLLLLMRCQSGTGAPGGIRTHDPWLRRPILYPLSYGRDEAQVYAGRRGSIDSLDRRHRKRRLRADPREE